MLRKRRRRRRPDGCGEGDVGSVYVDRNLCFGCTSVDDSDPHRRIIVIRQILLRGPRAEGLRRVCRELRRMLFVVSFEEFLVTRCARGSFRRQTIVCRHITPRRGGFGFASGVDYEKRARADGWRPRPLLRLGARND